MTALLVGSMVRCTLCREALDAPARFGGAEPHAVFFRTHGSGEGILLCGDCHTLAALPRGATLN